MTWMTEAWYKPGGGFPSRQGVHTSYQDTGAIHYWPHSHDFVSENFLLDVLGSVLKCRFLQRIWHQRGSKLPVWVCMLALLIWPTSWVVLSMTCRRCDLEKVRRRREVYGSLMVLVLMLILGSYCGSFILGYFKVSPRGWFSSGGSLIVQILSGVDGCLELLKSLQKRWPEVSTAVTCCDMTQNPTPRKIKITTIITSKTDQPRF